MGADVGPGCVLPGVGGGIGGPSLALKYDTGATLHDFYQISRRILNVPRVGSLALLRPWRGTFDERLLSCSRWIDAHQCVRGRVFEVFQHK